MAYKPYKMKGHTLPGINQRQSPAKDLEQNTSYTHPHLTPSSEGGIHTDKHGNTTGGPEQSKKSPAKQRDIGGTKSEKGNIFTKRGRTQRKINKSRAETEKLMKEHVISNQIKTSFAVADHHEKMLKKEVKNNPKAVIMRDGVDVTDQYRTKKAPKDAPSAAKWVQFIPAALSAMSSMSKKDEKEKEE